MKATDSVSKNGQKGKDQVLDEKQQIAADKETTLEMNTKTLFISFGGEPVTLYKMYFKIHEVYDWLHGAQLLFEELNNDKRDGLLDDARTRLLRIALEKTEETLNELLPDKDYKGCGFMVSHDTTPPSLEAEEEYWRRAREIQSSATRERNKKVAE